MGSKKAPKGTPNYRAMLVRKDQNLTMEVFAKSMGLNKSSISRLENGDNSLTTGNAKLICNEFNVNFDWLMEGIGSDNDETVIYNPVGDNEDKLIELAALITFLEDEGAQEVIDRILKDDRYQKLAKTLLSLEEPYFSIVEENIYATKKHSNG